MILDAIVDLLIGLLGPLVALLPNVDLHPFVVQASAGASTLGAYLGHADKVFPVSESLNVASLAVALMPIMLAYTAFKWIWRHIPTIAGFGTGDG